MNSLKLSALVIILCGSLLVNGQGNKTVNYLKPAAITFNNTLYNLSWSSHPSANYYKHEYLPKGQAAEKFKSMILLEVVTGNVEIKDIVSAKIKELQAMKAANPIVNYESFDNPATGEYMIDFLLSANSADGKTIMIIERNVYRYKKFTDKSGQTGVLLFGVSTREYGNNSDAFLTSLKQHKKELVNKLAQFTIPEIVISN